MPTCFKSYITAVTCMAVMFISAVLIGCVTPRHIDELKAQMREIESQNSRTQQILEQVDSTVSAEATASGRLRNDISITVDQLQQQIDLLLENFNDLMEKIEQMDRQKGILRPSPGAQTPDRSEQPIQAQTGFDCDLAYDEAFLQVRRSEYENAVANFRKFIDQCPSHASVENAHYWIGESFYSLEKFAEAIDEFELLVNTYRSSHNLGRAYYKLARSKEEVGKKAEAVTYYQKIVDDFPQTLEAEQARDRLKELK